MAMFDADGVPYTYGEWNAQDGDEEQSASVNALTEKGLNANMVRFERGSVLTGKRSMSIWPPLTMDTSYRQCGNGCSRRINERKSARPPREYAHSRTFGKEPLTCSLPLWEGERFLSRLARGGGVKQKPLPGGEGGTASSPLGEMSRNDRGDAKIRPDRVPPATPQCDWRFRRCLAPET